MSTIYGLAEKLKFGGYKLTLSRLAVVEALETHPKQLNHSQILEEGKKIYPKLSRATVYRTMELLVQLKLIRPLYLNDPTQRFVPVSADGGRHHLVCTSCCATFEFDYCTVDQLAQQLSKQYNFRSSAKVGRQPPSIPPHEGGSFRLSPLTRGELEGGKHG